MHMGTDLTLKLQFHPEHPSVFFTTSSDRTLRMFDIRSKRVNYPVLRASCGTTSLSFDPFRPNTCAVAFDDPFIRIYDMRYRPQVEDDKVGCTIRTSRQH